MKYNRQRIEMRYRHTSSLIQLCSLFLVLFGIFLRVWQYAVNRSLWLDEAMLALNIVNRSFGGLTQPLDYDQGAPIGFLIIEKMIVQLIGYQDYILRMFPLLSGIMAVFLMWKAAQNYIARSGALIALGLFVVSEQLIYYSSELKQYSSDVMILLLLLVIASKCMEESAKPSRLILLLAVVGTLGIWMSHPALFIVMGIGLVLSLDGFIKRGWRGLVQSAPLLLLWLASFFICYLISLRFLSANTDLTSYWRNYFMPMPPWTDAGWFSRAWYGLLYNPVGLSSVRIGTMILLSGFISILLKRWQLALLLVVPLALTLLASAFGKYPFGGRLLLFAVPTVFLLIAEGVERIRLVLLRINPWISFFATVILVTLFLYQPTWVALRNLKHPNMVEHIKPVLSYLIHNKVNRDSIYVYYGARAAFKYYASLHGLSEGDYIAGISSRQEPHKYIQDIDKLRGLNRVWIVFSHNCSWCKVNEKLFFLDHLDKLGVRVEEIESSGASLYLYDLSVQRSTE